MIDTHCHLDGPAFDSDRDAVLARARAAGVTDIVVPGVAPDGWLGLAGLAGASPGVHAALGIHPQALLELAPADDDRHLAALDAFLARGGGVAVGECGLDAPTAARGAGLDRQEAVLRGHLALARKLGLPVILHCLRAHEPMLTLLEREGVPAAGGVIHSFSGSAEQAGPFAALGLHFSFAGPLTYERARKPHAAARAVPLDRLLVETDAPDQTPRPHRGARNEPAHLGLVVSALAEAIGLPAAETGSLTAGNARRLFRLAETVP